MEFKNNNNKSFTKGEIDDYWRFLPFQYFFFFFQNTRPLFLRRLKVGIMLLWVKRQPIDQMIL